MEAIASGAADELAGRVLRAGDDLSKEAARCRTDPDYRRLAPDIGVSDEARGEYASW